MFARLILAAAFAVVPAIAGATMLVDGSFEAAGAGVANYCYSSQVAGGNAACTPNAWGLAGGVIRSGNGAWGGTTTSDGNYFGMLQSSQVLSQTVVATANGRLGLTWIDANRTNYGGAHSYTVSVNGTTLGRYTSGFGGFVAETAPTFAVVAGRSYKIAFNGIAAGDTSTFIDKVGVTATVPEPASWALMLAGFGLVGASVRRRRPGVVAA